MKHTRLVLMTALIMLFAVGIVSAGGYAPVPVEPTLTAAQAAAIAGAAVNFRGTYSAPGTFTIGSTHINSVQVIPGPWNDPVPIIPGPWNDPVPIIPGPWNDPVPIIPGPWNDPVPIIPGPWNN